MLQGFPELLLLGLHLLIFYIFLFLDVHLMLLLHGGHCLELLLLVGVYDVSLGSILYYFVIEIPLFIIELKGYTSDKKSNIPIYSKALCSSGSHLLALYTMCLSLYPSYL
jgi:hypothetical protein